MAETERELTLKRAKENLPENVSELNISCKNQNKSGMMVRQGDQGRLLSSEESAELTKVDNVR
jgi:hypothetical protein